jgi:hypothetical protein
MTNAQQIALKMALEYTEKLNQHIRAGNTVMFGDHKLKAPIDIDAQSGFIGFTRGHMIETLYNEDEGTSPADVRALFAIFEVFKKVDWL